MNSGTKCFERKVVPVVIALMLQLGMQSCAKREEPGKTSEAGTPTKSDETSSAKAPVSASEIQVEGVLVAAIGALSGSRNILLESEEVTYRLVTTKETEFEGIQTTGGSVIYKMGNMHRVRGIVFTPETRDSIGKKPNVFLKVIYIKDLGPVLKIY